MLSNARKTVWGWPCRFRLHQAFIPRPMEPLFKAMSPGPGRGVGDQTGSRGRGVTEGERNAQPAIGPAPSCRRWACERCWSVAVIWPHGGAAVLTHMGHQNIFGLSGEIFGRGSALGTGRRDSRCTVHTLACRARPPGHIRRGPEPPVVACGGAAPEP